MCNLAYNTKIAQLIRDGSSTGDKLLLRVELEKFLAENGIWTREDKLRMEKISLDIRAHELVLKRGGLQVKEARNIAIKMGELRAELFKLYQKRQQFDSATVESIAEDYRFDVMVSECVLYSDSDKKYFKNYEDYVERGDEKAAVEAAEKLAQMVYGYDPKFRMKFFENQWLKEAGYVDDNGRYVNKDGKFVDKDGKLINIDGRYIDENGNFVDADGNQVTDLGDFVVNNPKPFISENGEEVYIMQSVPDDKE